MDIDASGVVVDLPGMSTGSSIQKDPRLFCGVVRKRRNYLLEPMELPLPKFKYDKYWVGPVPDKEVTLANLNDNIDNKFLEEMCVKFGEIIECRVYYHPKTGKHLGLAKVLFQTQRAAKDCCLALNQATKMGNTMSVFLDQMGLQRSKMVEQICNPALAVKPALPNGNLSPHSFHPPLPVTTVPPPFHATSSSSPSSSSTSAPPHTTVDPTKSPSNAEALR